MQTMHDYTGTTKFAKTVARLLVNILYVIKYIMFYREIVFNLQRFKIMLTVPSNCDLLPLSTAHPNVRLVERLFAPMYMRFIHEDIIT